MPKKQFLLVIFSVVCFLAVGSAQARAEGFIDIYGGGAVTQDADANVSITFSSLGVVRREIDTKRADFRPALSETVSGTSLDIGVDLRAGIAWQFQKHLALFGEYRYTNFSADLENTDVLYGLAGSKDTIQTRLATNHFLIGISYRF